MDEEIKFNISENFSKNNTGLIAIDEIENIETLISNIIINESDVNKKGRNIIINSIEMNSNEFTKGVYILLDTCLRHYKDLENTPKMKKIYLTIKFLFKRKLKSY